MTKLLRVVNVCEVQGTKGGELDIHSLHYSKKLFWNQD